MFGRNASAVTEPTEVGDAPANNAVADDGDHTQRIMTRRPVGRTRPTPDEPSTAPIATKAPTVTSGTEPATVEKTPVADPSRWVHVSATATISLVVGVLAVAATLTGVLAPLGFAAGVLAVLLGVIAFASVSRRHVTGHGLVVAGLLLGLVAIVLSLLAMGDDLSWLSKDQNEVTTVHQWLNDHMHWLRRF
jgi:hypothetical protein